MADQAPPSPSADIGLGTLMFLIFMTLKLTDHISWSWVWVTSPLWISAILMVLLIVVAVLLTN